MARNAPDGNANKPKKTRSAPDDNANKPKKKTEKKPTESSAKPTKPAQASAKPTKPAKTPPSSKATQKAQDKPKNSDMAVEHPSESAMTLKDEIPPSNGFKRNKNPPHGRFNHHSPQKERWRKIDRALTVLLILALVGGVIGTIGLNRWYTTHTQKHFHPFTTQDLIARMHTFLLYLKHHWGPPQANDHSLGYEREIHAAALRYRIPANLLKAIVYAESGFLPHRISPTGAIGLMQLRPETIKKTKLSQLDLFLPAHNLQVGAAYLRQLLNQKKQISSALLAYHAHNRPHIHAAKLRHAYVQRITRSFHAFTRDPGQVIRLTARKSRPPKVRHKASVSSRIIGPIVAWFKQIRQPKTPAM